MQLTGTLQEDKITIKKSKNTARLNERSGFGKKNKNNLEISLLEGCFLLEEDKLKILQDNKPVDFKELMIKSTQKIENLELKYLVFRDLRKRGKIVAIYNKNNVDFCCLENKKKVCLIKVFSERSCINFDDLLNYIKKADDLETQLIFAVVDEEGDITYYISKSIDLKGSIEPMNSFKSEGYFFENRVIIFDEKISDK